MATSDEILRDTGAHVTKGDRSENGCIPGRESMPFISFYNL